MENMSVYEAYLAMFSFLEQHYQITHSDDLGALLGSMSLLKDGGTADPVIWEDWLKAANMAKSGQISANLSLK